MANGEQIRLLKQGPEVWNAWRRGKNFNPELSRANLDGVSLMGADLRGANLAGSSLVQTNLASADLTGARLNRAFMVEANLERARLNRTKLSGADIVGANLTGADLGGATMDAVDLSWTSLLGADLSDTDLTLARFRGAHMDKANLTGAFLDGTLFVDVDLKNVIGLDTCEHYGPSVVDHLTLQISGKLPISFLRGVGLPEALILSLPSLFDRAGPVYYTCFISYSGKDDLVARKLKTDLQLVNIRCWFSPHDMPIGAKILDQIHAEIVGRDKVLLILSENSIASDWVEDEVNKAFEEERK